MGGKKEGCREAPSRHSGDAFRSKQQELEVNSSGQIYMGLKTLSSKVMAKDSNELI